MNKKKIKKSTGKLINPYTGQTECTVCGQVWWANLKEAGKYHRGWKICPNCHPEGLKRVR